MLFIMYRLGQKLYCAFCKEKSQQNVGQIPTNLVLQFFSSSVVTQQWAWPFTAGPSTVLR